MKRFAILAPIVIWGCLAAPLGATNLLVNASFETGPDPGAAMQLSSGSTVIPGWVVQPANVDYVGTLWTAAQGTRSIGLNGSAAGAIAQTFTTSPGARYGVRFYMAGDPETEPLVKHVRVSAAGQSADFSVDITGMWSWDPGWNPRNWTFTAFSNSTTLQFASLETGNAGPSIDSVTVAVITPVDAGFDPRAGVALSAMSPNPMRSIGSVEFILPRPAAVDLGVFDVAGRRVATLRSGALPAGRNAATWDGRDGNVAAPAGIYFLVLQAGTEHQVRRVALVR
jgi:choice-of-anchor C domain-containing protein